MTLPLADRVLVNLAVSDRAAAARQVHDLLGEGLSLADFVDRGLAPAMAQVGALWECAVWTVADEHVATGVAEAALSAAAAHTAASPSGPDLVVGTPDGDWHSLPSRMLAEVLSGQGFSVRFLGASQPTDLLVDYVTRHRPAAVMLTCSIPMALPALAHAISGVRGLGVPVYVGGRALGTTAARALALGADGWAASASGAADLLHTTRVQQAADPSALAEYHVRDRFVGGWVNTAMAHLAEIEPRMPTVPPLALQRTHNDLTHLLTCASVSLLVRDPQLLLEQVSWLTKVLVSRGVAASAVDRGLAALRATAPAVDPAGDIDAVLALAIALRSEVATSGQG